MTNAENQRRYRDRQKSRWADLERRVKRLERIVADRRCPVDVADYPLVSPEENGATQDITLP